ncbi:hypothetical protein MKX59_12615 [Paenibacillus sp. FSL R7-0340]
MDEDGDTVFALYEDIEGYIHYRYCNYDTDKHNMLSVLFYKNFDGGGKGE